MNSLKYLFLLVCAFVALGSSAMAQSTGAKSPYRTVEIERFTIAPDVKFTPAEIDELAAYMVLHFKKSERFDSVFLSTDEAAKTAPVRRARVTGVITRYNKGSRAARYLVGLGAGRTKLVAETKVVDAETGQELFAKKVDGHVYGGFFGGETDAAKSNISSEIIKTMTKMGYASKTRNK